MEYVPKIVLEKISSNTLNGLRMYQKQSKAQGERKLSEYLFWRRQEKMLRSYLKSIQQFIKMIHMMAEWHIYTSGSNKRDNSSVYWKGNGSSKCQTNVRNAIEKATIIT